LIPASQKEQRISELFLLISNELNPGRVHALATELAQLLTPQARLHELSQRELRLAELVTEGLKNCEIAEKIGVSSKVVKNYLSNIYGKIPVRNRLELALWYETQVHKRKLQ